eukprot:SAG11_NODE_12267_length_712_cov_0.934747_1_plen_128_part_01
MGGVQWALGEEATNAYFRQNPKEITSSPPTGLAPRLAPVWRSTFADLSPVDGRDYFTKLAAAERGAAGGPAAPLETIGICIPCYNEPEAGLRNTLASLAALSVPPGFQLNVIILMDGVKPGVPADSTR